MWVMNGRAFAPPCSVCSTGVSTSRKPRACSSSRSDRVTVARSSAIWRACRVDDQVEVALPHPRLGVAQPGVLVRQRPQRLGGDRERVGQHRQLAAARGDHLAGRPRRGRRGRRRASRRRARRSPTRSSEIITWRSPVPSRIVAKQSLPPIAEQHDPPGHADPLAGRGVGRQVRVARADLRDRRGAREADRVRVDARRPAAGPACPAGPASARARSCGGGRGPAVIVGHLPEGTGPARARRQRFPGAVSSGVGVALVDQAQADQREPGLVRVDDADLVDDQRREPAGGDDRDRRPGRRATARPPSAWRCPRSGRRTRR